MEIAVQKYGGSSLASSAQIRRIAKHIEDGYAAGKSIVIVVSARGDTTDRLLEEAAGIGAARQPRELDQLLVTGENASAAMMALALSARGLPAVSLTGAQAGITVAGPHGDGIVAAVATARILAELERGRLVVVAGFHGANDDGDLVTLGRGGSDTTAVALGVALRASSCEVYTDVDGVHTADPRVVPDTRVLATVPAAVMAEMAFSGSRVLHSRAVELAAARGMDLVVRNSMSQSPGTMIVGRSSDVFETDGFVTAVTHNMDVAGVTMRATRASPGLVTDVLSAMARACVPVDMVSWSGPGQPGDTLRFAVRHSQLAEAMDAVRTVTYDRDWDLTVAEDVGTLSLVGIGLHSRPEYTVQMLEVLARIGVPAILFSSTQSRASVVVPRDRVAAGAVALHRTFALDQPGAIIDTPDHANGATTPRAGRDKRRDRVY